MCLYRGRGRESERERDRETDKERETDRERERESPLQENPCTYLGGTRLPHKKKH